jgi:hypothetical protein
MQIMLFPLNILHSYLLIGQWFILLLIILYSSLTIYLSNPLLIQVRLLNFSKIIYHVLTVPIIVLLVSVYPNIIELLPHDFFSIILLINLSLDFYFSKYSSRFRIHFLFNGVNLISEVTPKDEYHFII